MKPSHLWGFHVSSRCVCAVCHKTVKHEESWHKSLLGTLHAHWCQRNKPAVLKWKHLWTHAKAPFAQKLNAKKTQTLQIEKRRKKNEKSHLAPPQFYCDRTGSGFTHANAFLNTATLSPSYIWMLKFKLAFLSHCSGLPPQIIQLKRQFREAWQTCPQAQKRPLLWTITREIRAELKLIDSHISSSWFPELSKVTARR